MTLHGVAGRDHVAHEEYLRSHVDRGVIPSLCTVCATAIAPPSPPPPEVSFPFISHFQICAGGVSGGCGRGFQRISVCVCCVVLCCV